MRSNSSSVTVINDWFLCVTPALLTRMSTPPKASTAAATIASTSTRFVTSVVVATARPEPIASTHERAAAPLISATTTLAPSPANSSAMPRPKPDPPPVTIATLSLRRMSVSPLILAGALQRHLPACRELRRLLAKRTGRIRAENFRLRREERQFLERQLNGAIDGMAVDVGKEHRGVERTFFLIAFELRHIDAVRREAAKRFVERRRKVADAENEGGDDRPVAGFRVVGLLGKNDEARRVVRLVFHVGFQNLQTVNLGGQSRGDRGRRQIVALGDEPRRTRRVGSRHRRDTELAQRHAALAKRLRMAHHAFDRREAGAGLGHQLMAHAQEVL